MAKIADLCCYAYELGFRWRDVLRRMVERDHLRAEACDHVFLEELGIQSPTPRPTP